MSVQYRFVVRLTAIGMKPDRRDYAYAVCNTYAEASEMADALNARGVRVKNMLGDGVAWIDTLCN